MKQIRAFVRDDIPQVADLHRRVFHIGEKSGRQEISPRLKQSYAEYFENVFLKNPWYDESMPSLVYQESSGKISGFLGVMPRRMTFNERPITVCFTSQFIVDPDCINRLAGLQLLKTQFAGPQDLTMTDEANDISRQIWVGLGGEIASLLSIQWMRLFRPGGYALALAEKAGLPTGLSWAMKPFGSLIDTIAARSLPRFFNLPSPRISAEEMDNEALLGCLSEFSGGRALWPQYNLGSLAWLVERLGGEKKRLGVLRKSLFRGARGEITGWYLYHLNPGGVSNVVQLVARDKSFGDILDHLFHDAWQQGSISVTGKMDPRFMPEYSVRRCFFDCGKPWVLIQSRDTSILEAIRHGDALLSSLEGEMCMRFLKY